MERSGFNPNNYESTDDSSEESKTKKKKSLESSPKPAEQEVKKEVVADRGKPLWEKLVGADDQENLPKETTENEPAETAVEVAAETEDDPGLEVLTPEEDAEVTNQLIAHQLEQLQEQSVSDMEPAEAAAHQAAIEMLQNELQQNPDAAAESVEAEIEDEILSEEEAENDFGQESTPVELDDDRPVAVPRPPTRVAGGSSVPPTPPPRVPVFGSSSSSGRPTPPPVAPRPATPNTVTGPQRTEYTPDYRPNPNASYLLVGGVVGYLLGRRRGRIKTEKRMRVVQEKLEKQVAEKEQEIIAKTAEVQKKARENYEMRRSNERYEEPLSPKAIAMDRTTAETQAEGLKQQVETIAEVPVMKASPEQPATKRDERQPKKETAEPQPEKRHIELTDKDIARLSETITVGETSLRKVYEAKLITRSGLRRLVNEHLQGRDIRRGLAREFLAKELSYERDPHFRDLPADVRQSSKSGAAQSLVGDMLSITASANNSKTSSSGPIKELRNQYVVQPKSVVSTGLLTALTLLALGLAFFAVMIGLSR